LSVDEGGTDDDEAAELEVVRLEELDAAEEVLQVKVVDQHRFVCHGEIERRVSSGGRFCPSTKEAPTTTRQRRRRTSGSLREEGTTSRPRDARGRAT
jgi:hypothetical protein